jgi:lipopolysaccharide export LptBFGC system permease protein LptF
MTSTGTASQVLRDPQRRRITGKLVFLLAGTVSFLLSVGLWFLGDDRETALFVGLWVPSLFSLGALVASPERDR